MLTRSLNRSLSDQKEKRRRWVSYTKKTKNSQKCAILFLIFISKKQNTSSRFNNTLLSNVSTSLVEKAAASERLFFGGCPDFHVTGSRRRVASPVVFVAREFLVAVGATEAVFFAAAVDTVVLCARCEDAFFCRDNECIG
jgi:hypothetical protein